MNATRTQGVTLIETLAALALVAVVAPVLTRSWLIAMDAAARAQSQTIAATLAETRVNEIIEDRDFSQAQTTGDFGEGYPGYTWRATVADWELDNRMRQLEVTVEWTRRQQAYDVTVDTLIDSSGE